MVNLLMNAKLVTSISIIGKSTLIRNSQIQEKGIATLD